MKTIKLILLTLLITFSCLLLAACSEAVDEEEVNEESEEQVEEATIDDNDQNAGKGEKKDPEPFPGSTFKHEVDMKVNGEISEEKGEEWWKLD